MCQISCTENKIWNKQKTWRGNQINLEMSWVWQVRAQQQHWKYFQLAGKHSILQHIHQTKHILCEGWNCKWKINWENKICVSIIHLKKALKTNPPDVISICIIFVGTPFRENSTSVPMAVSEPMTSEKNYIC